VNNQTKKIVFLKKINTPKNRKKWSKTRATRKAMQNDLCDIMTCACSATTTKKNR
jgi:hypothetical protein